MGGRRQLRIFGAGLGLISALAVAGIVALPFIEGLAGYTEAPAGSDDIADLFGVV